MLGKKLRIANYQPLTTTLGFTFIELLIAVVTMALLMTVGFANYREYQGRQRLIAAARFFKADIRYAQELALSGTKPSAGCVVLDAYRLSWTSNTGYDISALCDAGASTPVSVKTVNLSDKLPGMQFSAAFTPIDFRVLGRGNNLTANLTITLRDSVDATKTVSVVVTPGGEIN